MVRKDVLNLYTYYMITDCGTVGSFVTNLDLMPGSSVQVSHLF